MTLLLLVVLDVKQNDIIFRPHITSLYFKYEPEATILFCNRKTARPADMESVSVVAREPRRNGGAGGAPDAGPGAAVMTIACALARGGERGLAGRRRDPRAWAVARSPEGRDGSAAPRLIDEGQRHEDVADLFRVGRNTLSRVPLCQSEKYYALH